MRIAYTAHALASIAERGLAAEWVERIVGQPDWIEHDAARPGVFLAFGRVAERDGRVLRVVYVDEGDERRILTAFIDRTRRHGRKGTGP